MYFSQTEMFFYVLAAIITITVTRCGVFSFFLVYQIMIRLKKLGEGLINFKRLFVIIFHRLSPLTVIFQPSLSGFLPVFT